LADRAMQPCVGQMRIREGLGAIERGLQDRHLRVEHVGAGRHAGGEPFADYTPRLGRGPQSVVGRGHCGTAGLNFGHALTNLEREDRVQFIETCLQGAA